MSAIFKNTKNHKEHWQPSDLASKNGRAHSAIFVVTKNNKQIGELTKSSMACTHRYQKKI
jgi:hypothetical protein